MRLARLLLLLMLLMLMLMLLLNAVQVSWLCVLRLNEAGERMLARVEAFKNGGDVSVGVPERRYGAGGGGGCSRSTLFHYCKSHQSVATLHLVSCCLRLSLAVIGAGAGGASTGSLETLLLLMEWC